MVMKKTSILVHHRAHYLLGPGDRLRHRPLCRPELRAADHLRRLPWRAGGAESRNPLVSPPWAGSRLFSPLTAGCFIRYKKEGLSLFERIGRVMEYRDTVRGRAILASSYLQAALSLFAEGRSPGEVRRGLLMPQDGGYIRVDDSGNLVVPAEHGRRFGLRPGARVRYDEGPQGLLLQRPVNHLARVVRRAPPRSAIWPAALASGMPGASPIGA